MINVWLIIYICEWEIIIYLLFLFKKIFIKFVYFNLVAKYLLIFSFSNYDLIFNNISKYFEKVLLKINFFSKKKNIFF